MLEHYVSKHRREEGEDEINMHKKLGSLALEEIANVSRKHITSTLHKNGTSRLSR